MVELYCSPEPAAAAAKSSSSIATTCGSCRLSGTVEAVAYVHRRDAAVKALSELKQDVTRSLTARLQMLENETASAAHDAAQQAQSKPAGKAGGGVGGGAGGSAAAAHPLLAEAGAARKTSRGLLRRVLMPWAGLGGVQVRTWEWHH